MLTINLTPKNIKEEVRLKRIYSLFKNFSYIIIIIIIAASSSLLIAKFMLQNSFNQIVGDSTLVTKNTQNYNIDVKTINDKLASISKVQNEYAVWSALLERITNLMNDGIKLNFIKLNRADNSLRISGHALTRESLLAFKDAIEKDKIFSNVDIPLKNLFDKNDIDFEIKPNFDINALR